MSNVLKSFSKYIVDSEAIRYFFFIISLDLNILYYHFKITIDRTSVDILKNKSFECSRSILHRIFEIQINQTFFTLQIILYSLILFFCLYKFRISYEKSIVSNSRNSILETFLNSKRFRSFNISINSPLVKTSYRRMIEFVKQCKIFHNFLLFSIKMELYPRSDVVTKLTPYNIVTISIPR